jgi:hypothetical protein
VRKTDDNFARELVTIDPRTGDTALANGLNLGLHIASIAFVRNPPLRIRSIIRNGGDVTIGWAGGTPPYQLQASPDLNPDSWTDVGAPTEALSATIPLTGSQRYFRVSGN